MYNEQLEALIDAALADGVLTEKEKQVLFKKAQAMGVDLDEFEMVLDSRLVKLQKEEAQKEQAAAPKSEKFGDVRKCPACGAIVPALAGVCPECGFEFSGVEANSSSQELALLLIEIESSNREKENILDLKRTSIESYPIPTTKADLFEFISSLSSKVQNGEKGLRGAYKTKLDECILKAQSLFPSDKQISKLISDVSFAQKNRRRRIIFLCASVVFLIFVAITISVVIINSPTRDSASCNKKVTKLIEKGQLDLANQTIDSFKKGQLNIVGSYIGLAYAYISADRVDDAMTLMDNFDWDYRAGDAKDIYKTIVNTLIQKGDIHGAEKAIEKYSKIHTYMYEVMKPYLLYLIADEKYGDAEKAFLSYNELNALTSTMEEYCDFLGNCIENMMRHGKKEMAVSFMQSKTRRFLRAAEKPGYSFWSREDAEAKLNGIIMSY